MTTNRYTDAMSDILDRALIIDRWCDDDSEIAYFISSLSYDGDCWSDQHLLWYHEEPVYSEGQPPKVFIENTLILALYKDWCGNG